MTLIRKPWSLPERAANAQYWLDNTLKALENVPMHGKRFRHIRSNLLQLRDLATMGRCDVLTNDQVRKVARYLERRTS